MLKLDLYCNLTNFRNVSNISDQLMNYLITRLFIEQPLALPGSANKPDAQAAG